MKSFTASGSSYKIGIKLGRLQKSGIIYKMGKYGISEKAVRKVRRNLEFVHSLCTDKYPEFVDEIKGMSKGSGVDYWKLLLLNSPEIRDGIGGCSSIALSSDKSVALFHNEDGNNWERKGDSALVKFVNGGRTCHSFTYAGELCGSGYSWNSYGLFFTVNYVKPVNENVSLMPRDFTAHSLLGARSLRHAVELLRANPDASGYHYYIGKGMEIISVEKLNSKLSVEKVAGIDYHTNHYIHREFLRRSVSSRNSAARLKRVGELVSLGKEPLSILADGKNKPDSVFGGEGCALRTLSTVAFYPLEKKVLVYDKGKLELRFALHP